jgi:hypothetical protein
MKWCVECYGQNQKTPATKLLDGDDLCDRNYTAATAGMVGRHEPKTADRVCGRQGCGARLTAANKSGFCAKHFYDSRRTADSKPRAPRTERKPEPEVRAEMPPVAIVPPVEPEPETVTVKVTAKSLDLIWSRLSLPERASLLFGGEA